MWEVRAITDDEVELFRHRLSRGFGSDVSDADADEDADSSVEFGIVSVTPDFGYTAGYYYDPDPARETELSNPRA